MRSCCSRILDLVFYLHLEFANPACMCVCVCGVSLVCVREGVMSLRASLSYFFFFFRGGHVLVTFGGGSNVGASPCKV